MYDSDRTERLAQIEAYAKTLVQQLRIMDERRYILQPLLVDEDIRGSLSEKFRDTYGAHAYNHLVPLLAHDLVRDLARLFLDEGSKAASFANLVRKISEQRIKEALRDQFRRIPDKWQEDPSPIPGLTEEETDQIRAGWRDRDREDFAKSFDDGLASVTAARAQLEEDPVAKKIKTFRDKYHAHLEMASLGEDPGPFDVGQLGLTFNDLLGFVDRYMPSIFELGRIVTGNVHDLEGFSEAHRRQGRDMWRVLAGLPEATE
jgi:hypothetical protein